MTVHPGDEQLALVAAKVRRSRTKPLPGPAEVDPIARVAVDIPLAHLDRPFDYVVPAPLSDSAAPGTRVRVRFAGTLVDGWVLERAATSEHTGRMERLAKVVSADPVLTPEVAALARAVADRWAGTMADVLRAAVPPRHAATEKALDAAVDREPAPSPAAPTDPGPWSAYTGGAALLTRLGTRRSCSAPPHPAPAPCGPRAPARTRPRPSPCWSPPPPHRAEAFLVVAPDARDVARLDAAPSPARSVRRTTEVLAADLGPAARYRAFLEVRRGHVERGGRHAGSPSSHRCATSGWSCSGTTATTSPGRAARALLARARGAGRCGPPRPARPRWCWLVGLPAFGRGGGRWSGRLGPRSGAAEGGAAPPRAPGCSPPAATPTSPATRRPAAPGCRTSRGRRPRPRWSADRSSCRCRAGATSRRSPAQTCREPARCTRCHGPLGLSSGHALPTCVWCGHLAGDWVCPRCSGRRLRAVSVGERRTAEELGRAFPGVVVRVSGRDPGARASSPRSTRPLRSSSRPRGPSRARRAATPPRCSSTGA